MLTYSRFRRLIAAVLLAWHVPACSASTGWRTQTIVPQETKRTMYAGNVQVETADSTYTFVGVWVSADSLGGWLPEGGAARAFPLSDVRAVRVWYEGGIRAEAGSKGYDASLDKHAAKGIVVGVIAVFAGLVIIFNRLHN